MSHGRYVIRCFPIEARTIALAVAFTVCSHTSHAQPSARPTLEDLAREVVALGPNEFVYGFRESGLIPAEMREPIRRFARLLTNANWREFDFLPLLRHANPKVRTLALVGIYYVDDPQLLPNILPLVSDAAETFPAIQPFAGTIGSAPPPMRPQMVGDIAAAILNTYMESGGYFYGPNGMRGEPGFEVYWKPRAQRTSTAGWWSLRLARAGYATVPTPNDRIADIRLLRSRINRLREPDRTYVLLWLHGDPGSDALVTAEELIKLSQMLGPDNLLDLLARKIRSDDPDLQPRPGNNYRYARMCLFILQNAQVLLRPGDASALLAQENWERDYQKHGISDPTINGWWAIAAAQLNDRSAESILKSAYARLQGTHEGFYRLDLADAIWRQTGNAKTAVDWFYGELAHPNGQESHHLNRMLTTPGRSAAPFVTAMIAHARFDELNMRSLEVLAKAMQVDLEAVSSPMVDFYYKDIGRARVDYPKETEVLLSTLARWRERLRQAGR